MRIAHLTDSPFFGGPERQMIGLSLELRPEIESRFLCFWHAGACRPFLDELGKRGLAADVVPAPPGSSVRVIRGVVRQLEQIQPDVLLAHGYKADILGWIAARRVGVPIAAVSRGWTGHTLKVRFNDWADRRVLRFVDRVICVSKGQAEKVRNAGVKPVKLEVIPNAIDLGRFSDPDTGSGSLLRDMFGSPCVVLGAGRLSREKGFDYLVAAAQHLRKSRPDIRFVVFGEGPERAPLEDMIARGNLDGVFALPGFRDDLDSLIGQADILVIPSLTEGLSNVALEACAAAIPVVATAVGGNPEVVIDGLNGRLVPARDSSALAAAISDLLADPALRRRMGTAGRELVARRFSFRQQSERYRAVLSELASLRSRGKSESGAPANELGSSGSVGRDSRKA